MAVALSGPPLVPVLNLFTPGIFKEVVSVLLKTKLNEASQ